jgi:sugar phosphate isomerase/epimerase
VQFVYFTKLLNGMTVAEMAKFLAAAGMQGPDLAVRDGYPVNPQNVERSLGEAKKVFEMHGLKLVMVTGPTSLIDAGAAEAQRLFDACGANDVQAIKIGYFRYTGDFRRDLDRSRQALAGFSKLAEKTGVRCCYHTHSGAYIGSNCAGMRLLLEDLDPHHVGAFVDTGHQTLGGAPFRMALDMVAPWLSLIAIKDVVWERTDKGWSQHVAPAGTGIADWREISQAVKDRAYDGVVSLHGEYHTRSFEERLELARQELAFLKRQFGID